MRLHKGLHQTEHLERLLRAVRVRPGNLDLYLELVGLEHVRRAVYQAGASLRVRYDDRLIADLEAAVGQGNVRLLGQRGATARIDAGASAVAGPRAPAPTAAARPRDRAVELEDSLSDDSDDL